MTAADTVPAESRQPPTLAQVRALLPLKETVLLIDQLLGQGHTRGSVTGQVAAHFEAVLDWPVVLPESAPGACSALLRSAIAGWVGARELQRVPAVRRSGRPVGDPEPSKPIEQPPDTQEER